MKIRPNINAISHIPASHGGIFSIKNPNEKIIDFVLKLYEKENILRGISGSKPPYKHF